MFMTHHAPQNGLDPGDRMPGAASILDEMDEFMADWSWRNGQSDPGYVYTTEEIEDYELFAELGIQMPAVRPWSFPAYVGPSVPPQRIGG